MDQDKNDYDWACRRLARLETVGFLSWLLTAFNEHLRFTQWLSERAASKKDTPKAIRDTLLELQELDLKRLWMFLIEFQLEPDPDMFGRLLIYLGTAWLELRPDELPKSRYNVAAAVVNLTGTSKSMPASVDMTLPGPDGVGCLVKVRERYIQDEPAIPLLQAIQAHQQDRILLPLTVAMQIDDIEEAIRLWLELWHSELDDGKKSEYVTLAKVFAELSVHSQRWQQTLEALKVQTKSPYLEKVRAATLVDALVDALEAKFPNQMSNDLRNAILSTPETTRLKQWVAIAATATCLDDFRKTAGL